MRGWWTVSVLGVVLGVGTIGWALSSFGGECDTAFDDLRFAGVVYARRPMSARDRLTTSDLGLVFGTVERNLAAEAGCDYRPRDGDAAELAVGTPVYAVCGYVPTSRLAAYADDGAIVLYEAITTDGTDRAPGRDRRRLILRSTQPPI